MSSVCSRVVAEWTHLGRRGRPRRQTRCRSPAPPPATDTPPSDRVTSRPVLSHRPAGGHLHIARFGRLCTATRPTECYKSHMKTFAVKRATCERRRPAPGRGEPSRAALFVCGGHFPPEPTFSGASSLSECVRSLCVRNLSIVVVAAMRGGGAASGSGAASCLAAGGGRGRAATTSVPSVRLRTTHQLKCRRSLMPEGPKRRRTRTRTERTATACSHRNWLPARDTHSLSSNFRVDIA